MHGRLGSSDSRLYVQWTLDYPDPRLSRSRTEIIAWVYNDLRMRVEQLTKKLLYTSLVSGIAIMCLTCLTSLKLS